MILLEDRIYGLSVLWKDLECNFAFWNKVPHINWNDVYKEYLSKVMNTQDDLSYLW